MAEITTSIPHQLTRAEAKRRIEEGIEAILRQYGKFPAHIERTWEGDKMAFLVKAMGVTVPGQIDVGDQLVWVRISLPLAFALLANSIRPTIEREGRKLLEKSESGNPGN